MAQAAQAWRSSNRRGSISITAGCHKYRKTHRLAGEFDRLMCHHFQHHLNIHAHATSKCIHVYRRIWRVCEIQSKMVHQVYTVQRPQYTSRPVDQYYIIHRWRSLEKVRDWEEWSYRKVQSLVLATVMSLHIMSLHAVVDRRFSEAGKGNTNWAVPSGQIWDMRNIQIPSVPMAWSSWAK